MSYCEAQEYLNSFVNYERLNLYPDQSSFKLERVRALLQLLGSPDQAFQAVHIAGSKGKGSTCAFLANILSEAGFKVGLYTSPHLIDLRERIGILQNEKLEKISKSDFARLIEKIKPYAEKLRKTDLGQLSYFEILTCLAFLYFKEKKCDFVVLETGIGGRLDATNVVSASVCAITPISYEHRRVLGNTLEKIAKEKAGIIKLEARSSRLPMHTHGGQAKLEVITAPQRPAALRIIRRQAKKARADLFEVGKDSQIKEKFSNLKGQSFDLRGILGKYHGLKIRLLGRHQIVNAAVAIGCVESLRSKRVNIPVQAIREGLRKTRWPGRLQIVSRRPRVVVDAAHNRASACALKDALRKLFKFEHLILVLGLSQDKDARGILKELLPLSAKIVLTKTENPRAMQPEIIKTLIKANARPIVLTSSSSEALKIARDSARQRDLILVCGSLFLVGEVLAVIASEAKQSHSSNDKCSLPIYRQPKEENS